MISLTFSYNFNKTLGYRNLKEKRQKIICVVIHDIIKKLSPLIRPWLKSRVLDICAMAIT